MPKFSMPKLYLQVAMLSVFPKLAILQLEALTEFDDIHGLHRRREVFAGNSTSGVITSVYSNPPHEPTKPDVGDHD